MRDIATGVERPVTQGSGEENYLISSPDARLVVFASNREGRWALYAAPLDRGPVANPLRIASLDANPSEKLGVWWMPDGRLALGLKFPESNIYRVAMDRKTGHKAGAPERLTHNAAENRAPAISPDGAHIAFWYTNGAKQGLAVMDAKGNKERPLLDHPIRSYDVPRLGWWSPEEILLHEAAPKDGRRPGFVTVNIKTGVVQSVPNGEVGYERWAYLPRRNEMLGSPSSGSPMSAFPLNALDAAVLSDLEPLVESVPRSPLKLISLIRGIERVIPAGHEKVAVALDFTVSSDAKRIAYLRINEADLNTLGKRIQSLMPARIPLEIRLMTIDGVDQKTLLRFPHFAPLNIISGKIPEPQSFSPDGKFLLYTSPDGRLRVADTETGDNWLLFGPYESMWSDGRWAKDGSIVVTGAGYRSDWKIWEGVTYDAVIKLMDVRGQK